MLLLTSYLHLLALRSSLDYVARVCVNYHIHGCEQAESITTLMKMAKNGRQGVFINEDAQRTRLAEQTSRLP